MKANFKTKKVFLFVVFIQFFVASFAQTHVDNTRQKLFDKNGKDVLVVAHRGDWRYAPENSLAAIENAIALGVDIVEIANNYISSNSNLSYLNP